jgi:hypothetical protein
MGVETNAILAINSLDRYNTDKVVNQFFADVGWQPAGTTTIDYLPIQTPGNTVPAVGSVLIGIQGPSAAGMVLGSVIIAVDVAQQQFTIDIPTQTDGSTGAVTWWEYKETYSFPTINNSLKRLYDINPAYPETLSLSGNDFSIQTSGSLIYGYITKIVVAQVQIQYNVPTINFNLNDYFYIADHATQTWQSVLIPFGFYYADELAAMLETQIQSIGGIWANMQVSFLPREGFVFEDTTSPTPLDFYFPSYEELETGFFPNVFAKSQATVTTVLKTYRLLGITIRNAYDQAVPTSIQKSFEYPNFLYTPYVDIYSDVLTNYQKIKDTNTSIKSPKGLIARIYLSGVGSINTGGAVADTGRSVGLLGTQPFVMTSDLNFPKVIAWTPDVTVTSIDFQLRDCYGDLLPGYDNGYSTEFQMTLLCTEGDT